MMKICCWVYLFYRSDRPRSCLYFVQIVFKEEYALAIEGDGGAAVSNVADEPRTQNAVSSIYSTSQVNDLLKMATSSFFLRSKMRQNTGEKEPGGTMSVK